MATLIRVAPEFPVDDLAETLQHYEQKLGFQVVLKLPDSSYAIVERDGVALHLYENESRAHSPASVHIFATGLDELFVELQMRGAQITQTIARQPWGNRDFRAMDPSGNVFKFTEPLHEDSH